MPDENNDGDTAELQPGDLTADEMVRLHDDLGPGRAAPGYRLAWQHWQDFVASVTASADGGARGARLAAYIAAHFDEPGGDRAIGGAAIAAAGALVERGAHAPPAAQPLDPTALDQAAGAHGAPAPPDAAAEQAAGRIATTEPEPPAKPRRHSRAWLAAAIVLLLLGGAAVAVALANGGSSKKDTTAAPATTRTAVARLVVDAKPIASDKTATVCGFHQTVRFTIVGGGAGYAGKTAIVTGQGSREGTVRPIVRSNGTFDATFYALPHQTATGACRADLKVTLVSVAGTAPAAVHT